MCALCSDSISTLQSLQFFHRPFETPIEASVYFDVFHRFSVGLSSESFSELKVIETLCSLVEPLFNISLSVCLDRYVHILS